ncbi:hypothetical protein PsYK624_106410 [Phanerochaete sordida]|uniref:DUF1793-domain-containing protein n=1 Tax=Phanerochaete sordida TaxID=48140 RepID=A0A9P3GGP4_9APHY|nr:hypothetical protein PsYK624_106410 [Phanerochaete sordida]
MLPRAHLLSLIFHLACVALVAHAQLSDSLWTSWVPLAVRSPYLSGWMNTTNIPYTPTVKRAPEFWPQFWSGGILGWAGHIRIDNNLTYKWLGDAGSPGGLNFSVLNNIQITPTRTVMSITSGPIDLNVTYLSPIEPSDPAKQSFPFTYISLTATSNDGQPHTVQVYSDISGEWVSGNRNDVMNWQTVPTDTILYHSVTLATPLAFSEITNQAEDTSTYFASLLTQQMTWMADSDANCRGQFSSQGKLTNSANQGPKKISDAFNVFAISMDLGEVTTTTDPVVWAVGMVRDPAVQAVTATGAQETRSPYWRTTGTAVDMLTSFLQDYSNAVERAESLDLALATNASAVSPHAADLVSLAARQAFAGTELTVGGSGTSFNTSDVKVFMKDLGATGRVNPVEVMYAAFPAFLSVNATWGGWLLRPVLDFAASPVWQQAYAPRDIGDSYPNATGSPVTAHVQGVEQSGNMLIMTVAHARATGDGSLIGAYYPVLKQWADYLVNNTSPMPSNQVTADVGSKPNSTNLAIKGIIAIAAMSQACAAMNEPADAQRYLSVAQAYANTWKSLALASDGHILSSYGDTANPSWALEYNLYADKWLGTDILDAATYSSETSFVQGLLAANPNGLPISSDQLSSSSNANADTAWTLFTAMTMTDSGVRSSLIDYVWNIASKNMSGSIFSTLVALDGKGGAESNSATSPGVGAMFAPIALSLPNSRITVPQLSNSTSTNSTSPDSPANSANSSHSNVGPIVGGVVGGIGLLVLLGVGFFLWRRRRAAEDEKLDAAATQPRPYSYARQTSQAWGSSATAHSPVDAPVAPAAPVGAYLRTTAKAAEARQTPPLATTGSAYTSSSGPASSREPPTVASRSDIASPVSPQEVQGLREEVQNLRLVMQSIRAEAMEPPPTYHEAED